MDGNFTVMSAYELLCNDVLPQPCVTKLWESVWKVIVPERIRVFLWLTVKQVLMTNQERVRRHLATDGLCQICKSDNETIIHVLRDCPAMYGIWLRLVPLRRRQEFFAKPLLEWVYSNISSVVKCEDGTEWKTVVAMAIWWGWKLRCMNVFGSSETCRDRIGLVKRLAREVMVAHQKLSKSSQQDPRSERMIAWTKPEVGWAKINTDGASRGNPGLATAGGVIRDEESRWCGGFALNIGVCSAPLAELWGVYYGLLIAWGKGYRRVVLEVDSEIVVKVLQTGIGEAHPLSFLVRLCHDCFTKDWEVQVTHVYREANRLAGGLANYAFSLDLGLHLLDSLPAALSSMFHDDANGVATPRLVGL